VDIRNKNDHPYAVGGQSKVYCVNGSKGRVLHLIRGHKYMFNVLQEPNSDGHYSHEFYFTECPVGGNGSPGYDNSPLKGCPSTCAGPLMLEVTQDLPDHFYYQDRKNRYMGALIVVHSKEEYKKLRKKNKKQERLE